MPTTIWVATANIYLGSGSNHVLAYTPGNVVPDSVVARYGLSTSGLVATATINDDGTSPDWRGVDPITRRELDEALADFSPATAHSALTGLAADDHPHYLTNERGDARYPRLTDPRLTDARTPTAHTHPATGISDSTATGRAVLTAADAAAARTAIGAGTSNLALGTTSTTAKAGDYSPPADAAAGTASMRTLGTGATQAAAGNDSRFTNARTPTAHASTHASGGSDQLGAELIRVAATGITATNVRDALLELLGMADDSGSYWSSTAKSLTNTTLSPDSDLNVPIGANEHVWLDWYYTFSGATAGTANLKASLSLPAGATAAWGSALDYDAAGSAGAAKGLLGTQTDTKTFKLANGTIGVHIRARVDNGATAGNVVINLAQNTADATPVTRDAWAKVTVDRAV